MDARNIEELDGGGLQRVTLTATYGDIFDTPSLIKAQRKKEESDRLAQEEKLRIAAEKEELKAEKERAKEERRIRLFCRETDCERKYTGRAEHSQNWMWCEKCGESTSSSFGFCPEHWNANGKRLMKAHEKDCTVVVTEPERKKQKKDD